MRIRTLLIGGTIASGAVVTVVLGYLFIHTRSLEDSLDQDRITRAIITSVFEQSEILSDYLLYPGERARIQWWKKHDVIGGLFDDLAASGGDEDRMLARMRINYRKKAEKFARLIETLERTDGNRAEGGRPYELLEHQIAQVRVASQSTFALAARMSQRAEERLLQTLYELVWGVAVLVATMLALLSGVWFIVGWRVVRPIAGLRQGILDFKGGQVGAWHGIGAVDEIRDVAHAFERMADNLNTVMVSRDELAKEVETRKEVERRAQEFAESLKVRTLELDAVNKELETFAYSVSHDLRAPLRSMAGFCQALVEDYGDKLDETGKDYVRRVSAASRHMGQLIDDMLKLSRLTRTTIERDQVDLTALVRRIIQQLEAGDPERAIKVEIEPDMRVCADQALLTALLQNLLQNAWKFTAKVPQPTIEVGTERANGVDIYFVRDNGAGFDMAFADKLFKPFQRLHSTEEFEGTGIGLATVARVANRHGGRVWADSTVGKGTTIRFTL